MAVTKVLVPLDGSPLSDRILDRIRPFLARDGVQTLLLGVQRDAAEGADGERRHLQRVQLQLRAAGIVADYRVRAGDPAAEILSVADHFEPTVIAMSTHGRSGILRWVLGSVAERVLRGSRHPVLVANPLALGTPDTLPPVRRILVPLDGSELSAGILPLVAEVAKGYGSEVVLFRASPEPYLPPRLPILYPGAQPTLADITASLAPFQNRLGEADVAADLRAALGEPAPAILDAVRDARVDLVALTTHGRSGPSRWVYGSVTEKVLRACPVPLLVQRTAAFAEAGGEAA